MIKRCKYCGGQGYTYGHGAFGESESFRCCACDGEGFTLNWDKYKKDKMKW